MAERLDDFEWSRAGKKYPWDQWFNGEVWKLTKGEDFTIRVDSMITSAYQIAKKRGVRVRVRRIEDEQALVLQRLSSE